MMRFRIKHFLIFISAIAGLLWLVTVVNTETVEIRLNSMAAMERGAFSYNGMDPDYVMSFEIISNDKTTRGFLQAQYGYNPILKANIERDDIADFTQKNVKFRFQKYVFPFREPRTAVDIIANSFDSSFIFPYSE